MYWNYGLVLFTEVFIYLLFIYPLLTMFLFRDKLVNTEKDQPEEEAYIELNVKHLFF